MKIFKNHTFKVLEIFFRSHTDFISWSLKYLFSSDPLHFRKKKFCSPLLLALHAYYSIICKIKIANKLNDYKRKKCIT